MTVAGGGTLALRGVDFSYGEQKPVFKNFSVEFGAESPVMILGASGCGKTTLLHLIADLRTPGAGEIISTYAPLSMVFQEPRLLPWKTVRENVSLPLIGSMNRRAAAEKALRCLRLVSLEDKADTYPAELSGGQRQRVNLARAFVSPGALMLMDEPFQSLDIPLRIELMDLTRALLETSARESNITPLVLIVTHDSREAVYMGKRIIVLGERPQGVIFDERLDLPPEERAYGSAAQGRMERKILNVWKNCGLGMGNEQGTNSKIVVRTHSVLPTRTDYEQISLIPDPHSLLPTPQHSNGQSSWKLLL